MSTKEGVYYAAWMIAIVVSVSISRLLGWPHLVGLGIGVIGGLGLGVLAERAFEKHFGRAPSESPGGGYSGKPSEPQVLQPGEVACRNPQCHWVGKGRDHMRCPKCREQLM